MNLRIIINISNQLEMVSFQVEFSISQDFETWRRKFGNITSLDIVCFQYLSNHTDYDNRKTAHICQCDHRYTPHPCFHSLGSQVERKRSERVLLEDKDCLAERALPLRCVMRCDEQSWPQRCHELKRPWAFLDPRILPQTHSETGRWPGKTHVCSCVPVVSAHGFWDSQ